MLASFGHLRYFAYHARKSHATHSKNKRIKLYTKSSMPYSNSEAQTNIIYAIIHFGLLLLFIKVLSIHHHKFNKSNKAYKTINFEMLYHLKSATVYSLTVASIITPTLNMKISSSVPCSNSERQTHII